MHFAKHVLIFAVAFSLVAVPGWAQVAHHRPTSSAAPSSATPKAMGNADIIQMVGLGLPNDIIIEKIRTAQATNFDTSIRGLKALKAAKVSNDVLRAMLQPQSQPQPQLQTQTEPVAKIAGDTVPDAVKPPANANMEDPASPHDPGIYMYTKNGSGKQLMMLESSAYSQGKMGGFFGSAMTYGIKKIKTKAVVSGAHAAVRTSDSRVYFYFYFDDSNKSFGGSTTPNEYTLLKFDVKADSRETLTGTMNAFGSSSGADSKANIAYTYTKIGPGIYKVVPNQPLYPGEYCFLPAGQAGPGVASRLFAFGITAQ